MNLTEKLNQLIAEKESQTNAKEAAHNRIIVLNRLIKSTESLIKDAEEVFASEAKPELTTSSVNGKATTGTEVQ